jgi:plastocyanin
MNKTVWWVIGVVVVIVVGLYLWMSQASAPSTDQSGTSSTSTSIDMGTSTAPMSATVSYDGNSFSPSSVTVMQGGTVTFVDTAGSMWIASDPHPEHNGYDGTTRQQHCASGYSGATPFDECSSGSTFSFTFDKAGSWGYHDHLNDGAQGTVVVQ